MQTAQAINYLETVASIPAADMSPAMLKLMRSAARLVANQYPVNQDGGIDGYYDPEFFGVRANVGRFLFRANTAPLVKIQNDPYASTLDLI